MGKSKAKNKKQESPVLLFIKKNLKNIIIIASIVAIVAVGITVGVIVGRRTIAINGVKYEMNDSLGGYVASAADAEIKYATVKAEIDGVPVVALADAAFKNCADLRSLELPSSLKSIGREAFDGCESLEYNVSNDAKYLGNSDNPYLVLASYADTEARNAIMLESGLKIIAPRAFYDNKYLLTVCKGERGE